MPDYNFRMNLTSNPTPQQLASMMSLCDDEAAHHMIWVDYDGGVHIDALPQGMIPAKYADITNVANKFRLETFVRGNRYVGKGAAQDVKHVDRIYQTLIREWKAGTEGYVDNF